MCRSRYRCRVVFRGTSCVAKCNTTHHRKDQQWCCQPESPRTQKTKPDGKTNPPDSSGGRIRGAASVNSATAETERLHVSRRIIRNTSWILFCPGRGFTVYLSFPESAALPRPFDTLRQAQGAVQVAGRISWMIPRRGFLFCLLPGKESDVGRQECPPACAAYCLPVRVRTQTGAAGRPHLHIGFLRVCAQAGRHALQAGPTFTPASLVCECACAGCRG